MAKSIDVGGVTDHRILEDKRIEFTGGSKFRVLIGEPIRTLH